MRAPLPCFLIVLAAGCAPAMPLVGGGRTTPARRVDLGAGGAARIPLGELAEAAAGDAPLSSAAPGGVAPVASARFGIAGETDAGLLVSGPLARADLRHGLVLADDDMRLSILGSVAGFVGWVDDRADDSDGGALRMGAEIPLLFGLDVQSVVELWVGPRVGVERVAGRMHGAMDAQDLEITAWRLGGVVGVGAGFRHFHALVELGAGWESYDGEHGPAGVSVSGFVLSPAFVLRLRI